MTRDELNKALLVERFGGPVDKPVRKPTKRGGKPVDRYVKAGGAFDDSDVATTRRRRLLNEAIGQHEKRTA